MYTSSRLSVVTGIVRLPLLLLMGLVEFPRYHPMLVYGISLEQLHLNVLPTIPVVGHDACNPKDKIQSRNIAVNTLTLIVEVMAVLMCRRQSHD